MEKMKIKTLKFYRKIFAEIFKDDMVKYLMESYILTLEAITNLKQQQEQHQPLLKFT